MFFDLMLSVANYPLVQLLCVRDGKKGYRCFEPIRHKLYVSRHVCFLIFLHFPFHPTLLLCHSLITFSVTFLVAMLNPIFVDIDLDPHEHTSASPTSFIPSRPPRIDDLPPRPSDQIHKSTHLFDFTYPTYSPSFTSFHTSILKIFEPTFYK